MDQELEELVLVVVEVEVVGLEQGLDLVLVVVQVVELVELEELDLVLLMYLH